MSPVINLTVAQCVVARPGPEDYLGDYAMHEVYPGIREGSPSRVSGYGDSLAVEHSRHLMLAWVVSGKPGTSFVNVASYPGIGSAG